MTRTFCDMCGCVIGSSKETRKLIIGNSGSHVYRYNDGTYDKLTFSGDICLDCAQKIIDSLCEDARVKVKSSESEEIVKERVPIDA